MWSKAYNSSKLATLVWLLAMIFSCSLQNADAAINNDYCVTPPYIGSTLPNLLLMFDNSSSQYDLASFNTETNTMFCYDNTYKNSQYCTMTQSVTCNTTTETCSSKGGVGQICSLVSGSTTTGICSYPTVTSGTTPCTSNANCGSNTNQACLSQYAGYFDEDTYYISTNGVSYATDITLGNPTFSSFARDTGWPHAGCTYQTAYLCVITTGSPPTDVTMFAAKGSFLNWLAASKMDIQKKILTGGKLDTTVTPNVLVSEGRGCVGGRFVKEIPETDWIGSPTGRIVFGVRGDVSADVRVPSEGGTTRIDIFYGSSGFNNADCQAAVRCWSTCGTNCGTCKSLSDTCVSLSAHGGPLTTWEHTLSRCWQCGSTCCPSDFNSGDTNPITSNSECGGLTDAQMAALTSSDPMYICLRDTNPDLTPLGLAPPDCTTAPKTPASDLASYPGGYIGVCHKSDGTWDNTCVQYQFANACRGLQVTDVVDPTNDTADTSGTGNIPGALIEAALNGQLGNPIKTFHVRVVPLDVNNVTGLVQKFQNNIRFGVMKFNTYGSLSECYQTNSNISYKCSQPGNKDGGSIPTGAYIGDSIGDHSSGLVNAIDIIRATTWTPFSEAFYNAIGYFANKSSGNFPITSGDYDITKNPVQSPCQLNNVLIITDGQSTADLNSKVKNAVFANHHDSQYDTGVVSSTTCTALSPIKFAGSRNLNDLAWVAQNFSIAAFSSAPTSSVTATPTSKSDKISTYVVYSGTSTAATNECNPAVLMNDTATQGGTSLYSASNPQLLQNQIEAALAAISSKAAAGTAASVLASGEGSGANLIQAVFYPQRQFTNTATNAFDTVSWIGRLTNLWYYVDPFLGSSSIREDNGCPGCTLTQPNPTPWNGNKTLDLLASSATTSGDYIINMFYDPTAGVTKAHRWKDPNGTGVIGTQLPDIGFEDLGYLWEAGTLLWERNLSTSPRTIKTSLGSTPPAFIDFPTASLSTSPSISTYMDAGSLTGQLVTWVTGSDVNIGTGPTNFRSRNVKIESIDLTPRVWKLGDVVNSTPKLMSWTSLNNYGLRYGDTTYGSSGALESAADSSHFVTTSDYKNRGVVFAGGNDGMLHAFKLGTLQLSWDGRSSTQKARMVVDSTSGTLCTAGTTTTAPTCGQEIWAFIPKNVLPYLKYTAAPNYCHINAVDLTPFIFDASIGGLTDTADTTRTTSMWRTVLIGGMRFGGACKSFNDTCTSPGNCVKNPVNDVGYSSYFAIDITDADPNNWQLLWEFSDPTLGFTTSGPAVIRLNGSDQSKNGNWFVVFGSGPTGPISTSDHQFLGQSDQPLRLFVLDLKTGAVLRTIGPTDINIPDAFAGSLLGGPLDIDEDYQDEVLYVPYVKKDTSAGTWTKGGVLRLMTKKDPLPANWQVSTLIDNNDIGPVTSAVVKINDKTANKLWTFFGEGRYYYLKSDSSDDPSPSVNRRLFGIKDTCLPQMKMAGASCSDTVAFSDLVDVTSNSAASEDPQGWFLSLDPANATAGLNAEREITDPLATSGGVVYFTTYKPYTDLCTLGGKTFIWAMKYNTGGCVNTINGKVLVQVSTGAIQQQDLSQVFGCNLPSPGSPGSPFATGDDQKRGRRSPAMEGKPPEMQGLSVMSAPGGANRTIHVRER